MDNDNLRKRIGFELYKKWFIQNIMLLIAAIVLFLISLFVFKNWTIYVSIMFILMCLGWSATALAGMKENKVD